MGLRQFGEALARLDLRGNALDLQLGGVLVGTVVDQDVAGTTLLLRRVARFLLGILLVVASVALTVFAGPLFRVTDAAADELLQRTPYVQAVLGGDR